MPIEFFTVEPSADIYLSLADNPTITLRLWVYDCTAGPAYVNLPHPDVSLVQTRFDVIDNVNAGPTIRAKSPGTSFVRITYSDTANGLFHELVIRVSVFASFKDVWLGGNGKATVHDGRDDLVISVYARSPAGDVGDITGHGFMTFSSLNPRIASVYANTGRAIGVTIGTATIRGQYRGNQYDTVVDVIPDFNQPREIVEKVWYSGAGPENKNFLFLAEGFTEDEYPRFKKIVYSIASRMRRSRAHEPFRLLKDRYNIWLAFEPSLESGASVGPLIDSTTGRDPQIPQLNPPQPQRIHQPLQVRASRLGLMYGHRMGDRYSQVYGTRASAPMDATWYIPVEQLSVFRNDPRRTPTNSETWKPNMFAYLNSLKTTEGNADPNYNIGRKWNIDGPDQGHVIVIVNDDHLGGNYLITASAPGEVMYLWGVISINQTHRFNLVTANRPGIDHRPGKPGSLRAPTVAVAVHELCHSFFLGDEYEGLNPFPNSDPAVAQIEWSYNITTGYFLVTGGVPFKWAELKRMERSSAILKDAASAAAGSLVVELFPGEGAKWAVGPAQYYLRTVNCNQGSQLSTSLRMCAAAQPIHQHYPARHRHEPKQYLVTVANVNGDTVTLREAPGSPATIAIGTVIPARSVLFAAKKHNGQELGLVLPGTLDVLKGNRGLGGTPAPGVPTALFDKGGACAPNTAASYPPAGIPDITYPKRQETLIGLYEGAGQFNCDVYRSSGMSKMRDEYNTRVIVFTQHFRLDHLSKYVIVNQIDPSRHDLLDQDYPGEPL